MYACCTIELACSVRVVLSSLLPPCLKKLKTCILAVVQAGSVCDESALWGIWDDTCTQQVLVSYLALQKGAPRKVTLFLYLETWLNVAVPGARAVRHARNQQLHDAIHNPLHSITREYTLRHVALRM
jgi:hypothetical protein